MRKKTRRASSLHSPHSFSFHPIHLEFVSVPSNPSRICLTKQKYPSYADLFPSQDISSMFARTAISRTSGAVRSLSTSAPRADLARMQLIGRLVADPEVKQTVNGKEFAAYTIATNDIMLSSNKDREFG